MPSAFAHAAVGASFAAALPRTSRPVWVPIALGLLAAAPDLDVIAFRLGIPYAHVLGHRGLSHSLFFAVAVGWASLPLWRLAGLERARLAAALTACAIASHGLLDTFTDAGLGVGLLIPVTDTRYFAAFRPLMTSPLSARAFLSPHGVAILANELMWIGPVVVFVGLGAWGARRRLTGQGRCVEPHLLGAAVTPIEAIRSWALSMFQVAQPASSARNLLKTYLQTSVFWLVFLLAAPWLLHQVEEAWSIPGFHFDGQVWVGVAVFAVFGLGALASAYSMAVHGHGTPLPVESPRELVISGPYAYVRNPMGVTGLAQGAAVAVAIGSPLMLLFVLCGGIVWNQLLRPLEEHDLVERFGSEYEAYRSAVRCWIPRLEPYRHRDGVS